MSAWTTFRNALEAILDPEIAAATTFGQAVLSDIEAAASGNITSAFDNGVAAFETTPGGLEAKAIAALVALGTTLLGYEIAIIKKDAAKAAVELEASTEASPLHPEEGDVTIAAVPASP